MPNRIFSALMPESRTQRVDKPGQRPLKKTRAFSRFKAPRSSEERTGVKSSSNQTQWFISPPNTSSNAQPSVSEIPPKKPPRLYASVDTEPPGTTQAQEQANSTNNMQSTNYAYSFDPGLHPSQKPSEVPKVKRNLVRDIVAQFNDEAYKREVIPENGVRRETSPLLTEATPDNAPNQNIPFSYTTNGGGKVLGQRSRSELDIQQATPPDLIYAKVVVNGTPAERTKTTVHTKVPNRTFGSALLNGSSKKLFSKSTTSLMFGKDGTSGTDSANFPKHQSKLQNHSYYKFDQVDDEFSPQSTALAENRKVHVDSNGYGRLRDPRKQQLRVRSQSLNIDSDGEDSVFERSRLGRPGDLQHTNGLQGSTRNIEKWSEKEEGPNMRKYTEHEYVHEVRTSKNDSPDRSYLRSLSQDNALQDVPRLLNREENNGDIFSKHGTMPGPYRNKKINKENESHSYTSVSKKPAHTNISQYYFGETPQVGWCSTDNLNARLTHSRLTEHQRRNSSDSGSGVGLLSSKLVKKADAEVNASYHSEQEEQRHIRKQHRYEDSYSEANQDKLHTGGRVVPRSPFWTEKDPERHPPGLLAGEHVKEQKRTFRKEERTHTTKHETRRPMAEHGSRSPERPSEGALLPRTPERVKGLLALSGGSRLTQLEEREQRKLNERRTNVEVSEKRTRRQRHRTHSGGGSGSFVEEERMELSGSEPQLYSGSQDSRMSSRLSSADEDAVVAAHVNTPKSMVKQLSKNQISYENQQKQYDEMSSSGHPRLWFERGVDEVDNSQRWSSATMSRLESKKNHRNVEDHRRHMLVNTIDRHDLRRRKKKGSNDNIRILLNDQEMSDGGRNGVGRSSSFNSRVSSYHSENESQKSTGSSAASKPKRVNFKSSTRSSPTRNGYGSRSDLSPIHREALLRSASPIRAPSTTGSLKSNVSDASQASSKSVILHAATVADIPPARQYCYRSANTSPVPGVSGASSVSGGGRESKTVRRSFSLLSPWKPKKYKEKYEKKKHVDGEVYQNGRRYSYVDEPRARNHSKERLRPGDAASRNSSSSERLDSLPPLVSEVPQPSRKPKKKSGLSRRHSMPKDSRFANFFRRKKEAKAAPHDGRIHNDL